MSNAMTEYLKKYVANPSPKPSAAGDAAAKKKMDYLQKYMTPANDVKKKRKKKKEGSKNKTSKGCGMRIVDDDVGWDEIKVNSDEEDPTKYMTMDEKPQIVDDNKNAYDDVTKWKGFGEEQVPDDVIIAKPSRSRRRRHDSSDESPPRRKQRHDSSDEEETVKKSTKRHDSDMDVPTNPPHTQDDSDLDVPRGGGDDSDLDVPRGTTHDEGDDDSDLDDLRSMSANVKMQDGGSGGLISLSDHRKEVEKKKRENQKRKMAEKFQRTETIRRDGNSGQLRDTSEEKKLKEEKEAKQKKRNEKYAQWSKGLKQAEMNEQNARDVLYEESKPLARYRDDKDLDQLLRNEIREEDDPMAAYIMKKKQKNNQQNNQLAAFPKYQGPAPAPNRYKIQPGYRWDGVDRSNGFEDRYFISLSDKSAQQLAYHQWSVNDM